MAKRKVEQEKVEQEVDNTTIPALTFTAVLMHAVSGQKVVDEQTSTVSNEMLTLAKGLLDDKGLLKTADFEAECAKAEEAYRGSQDLKLPRVWINAKSSMKQAAKHGLDFTKFETESSLRKTWSAVANAKKSASTADTSKTGSSKKDSDNGVVDMPFETSLKAPELTGIFEALHTIYDKAPDDIKDEMKGKLESIVTEYREKAQQFLGAVGNPRAAGGESGEIEEVTANAI